MIFLSSLLFCVLYWPVEPLLVGLAPMLPLPYPLALILLNGALYAVVLAAVRAGRKFYTDLAVRPISVQGVQLHDWMRVSTCRWLNTLGFVGITGGAVVLAMSGMLPLPFWFLYVGVIVGLADVFGRTRLVELPSDLPQPRFDPERVAPVDEEHGKRVEFHWHPWSASAERCAGASGEELSAVFSIEAESYQQAVTQPRLPATARESYLRYVRSDFPRSVQQVAAYLRYQSEERAFTCLEELGSVVAFTRAIPYASDEETHGVPDYANYPVETLYEAAGDCEDHAILAACLLYYLGHDVGLFFLTLNNSAHTALGYRTEAGAGPFRARDAAGREYFYVETVPTGDEQRIGNIPAEFLRNLQACEVLAVR